MPSAIVRVPLAVELVEYQAVFGLVLGNWLMEGVGVWVVGQVALVQLGFCLCVRVGEGGHLVLLCLGGAGGSVL